MKIQSFFYILIVIVLSSCNGSYRFTKTTKKGVNKGAPSGKYRNPALFSRAHLFQGAAKARLNKNKRKKIRLFKRKRKQAGTFRKFKKPGRSFQMKHTVSRKRLKSSGNRIRYGSSKQKKNKNLFKTRKK